GDPGAQELLAQVQPGGLGEVGRVVGELGRGRPADLAHLPGEDVPDLAAVAVDGGYQDVRREVVSQLDDQLGEVGLPDVDAGAVQRRVQLDLLGGHRLDFDDLAGVVPPGEFDHDGVGLGRVPGPVHHATGRGDPLLQLQQQFGQPGHGVVLDGCA